MNNNFLNLMNKLFHYKISIKNYKIILKTLMKIFLNALMIYNN